MVDKRQTTKHFINCLQFLLLFLVLKNVESASIGANIYTNEIKSGPLVNLCGDSFVMAWRYICQYKYQGNGVEKKRSRRSIEDFVKLRTLKFVSKSEKGALSFLKTRHRRQIQILGTDNADEECCKEGCSYSEVSEYEC